MSKINIVIVGAGKIALEHCKVLSSLKEINLLCICSRTLKKANNLARKYKIENTTTDTNKFINNNFYKIHGIMILVSVDQIYKVTKDLAKFSIPLFIEKPPSLNFIELKKLNKILNKNNAPNMIGMNRRFYSIFEKGKKLIDQNGGLLSVIIEGHERFSVIKNLFSKKILKKWLYANSCHTIDLIRYFGGELKYLKFVKKSEILKNGDHFSCSFKYKNGAIGTYISNWLSPGGWSVRLYAKNLKIIFEPLEQGYYIKNNSKKHIIRPDSCDLNYKYGFYKQMKSFIYLIKYRKNCYPSQNINEILKTFQIINEISV